MKTMEMYKAILADIRSKIAVGVLYGYRAEVMAERSLIAMLEEGIDYEVAELIIKDAIK